VQRLRRNQPITETDIAELERLLGEVGGTAPDPLAVPLPDPPPDRRFDDFADFFTPAPALRRPG